MSQVGTIASILQSLLEALETEVKTKTTFKVKAFTHVADLVGQALPSSVQLLVLYQIPQIPRHCVS